MEDQAEFSTRAACLGRIEAFLTHTRMSERQLGLLAVGDHRFVKRLRNGAGVTLTVIDKAEQWMRDHPQGAPAEQAKAG